MALTIASQNEEYLISLFQDQMKDLEFHREQERQRILLELQKILPESLDSILTRNELRLMNLYRLSPQSLNPTEKSNIEELSANLQRWRNGGCYNLSANQEAMYKDRLYYFSHPKLAVSVCTDLYDQSLPSISIELGLVDLNLNFGPGRNYRYPLTSEESKVYIQRLRNSGIVPEQLPQLNFSDISKTLESMASL